MATAHRQVRSLVSRVDTVRGFVAINIREGKPLSPKVMREGDAIVWALEAMHAAGMIPATIAGEVVTSCAEWHRMNWRQFVQTSTP